MRYALISYEGSPITVFIEEGDRVVVRTSNPDADKNMQAAQDEEGLTTVGQAMGSGYSYCDVEIGEYEGDAKKRVDEIVDALGKTANSE